MDAKVAHNLLDPVLHEIAVAAMQLQRLVGDLESGRGRWRRRLKIMLVYSLMPSRDCSLRRSNR